MNLCSVMVGVRTRVTHVNKGTNMYVRNEDINVLRTTADTVPYFKVLVHPANGCAYAVFNDQYDLIEYDNRFTGHFCDCAIICYGGYMNAFELGPLH